MIRLLLADDENLIRSALAALLGLEDDLQVVAEAGSGTEALALAREPCPDVALLDLQMPGPDGIAVAEVLRRELPGCATIIVTSHGRPGHLKRVLAAGARGFLPKTASARELREQPFGHPRPAHRYPFVWGCPAGAGLVRAPEYPAHLALAPPSCYP